MVVDERESEVLRAFTALNVSPRGRLELAGIQSGYPVENLCLLNLLVLDDRMANWLSDWKGYYSLFRQRLTLNVAQTLSSCSDYQLQKEMQEQC